MVQQNTSSQHNGSTHATSESSRWMPTNLMKSVPRPWVVYCNIGTEGGSGSHRDQVRPLVGQSKPPQWKDQCCEESARGGPPYPHVLDPASHWTVAKDRMKQSQMLNVLFYIAYDGNSTKTFWFRKKIILPNSWSRSLYFTLEWIVCVIYSLLFIYCDRCWWL